MVIEALLAGCVGLYALGLLLKFKGLGEYEILHGEVDGYILFLPDGIQVAGHVYPIETIEKVAFSGIDFMGATKHTDFLDVTGFFENDQSMGVNNTLHLHFNDGSVLSTRFQKTKACELAEAKDAIISYYLKEKITYLEVVDILCLTAPAEWDALKKLKQVHPQT